jgi:hypothetical protein
VLYGSSADLAIHACSSQQLLPHENLMSKLDNDQSGKVVKIL